MIRYRQLKTTPHKREVTKMKKDMQTRINDECVQAYEKAMIDYGKHLGHLYEKRLRTCTAHVYETPEWYILQSYKTPIAVINRATDTCYDVLRYVYGYTSTSAQHIAKFRKDYGSGKWGCAHELRWVAVN